MLSRHDDESLALHLAMIVNDKSDGELEELAQSNPHLHREWLDELNAARQRARAQTELCETVVSRLRVAAQATFSNAA